MWVERARGRGTNKAGRRKTGKNERRGEKKRGGCRKKERRKIHQEGTLLSVRRDVCECQGRAKEEKREGTREGVFE